MGSGPRPAQVQPLAFDAFGGKGRFQRPHIALDPAAKAKFWKDPKVPELLAKLADALAAIATADWSHDACDHALRALAEAEGVKAGLLINATRVAIVGQAVAPPLFDTMVALGRDAVVSRLQRANSKSCRPDGASSWTISLPPFTPTCSVN